MDRAAIVSLDKRHVWHPYTAMDAYIDGTDPFVIVEAEGAWLTDADGARYLDANASWWVASFGHRHPRLVRALVEQAMTMPHVSLAGTTHAPVARLAGALCGMAPEGLSRVFFSDDGSTAVEVALKLCGQYWAQNGHPSRTRFVTLSGAFHGETFGATSVGGVDAFREVFGPWCFDVIRAPSPAEPDGWARAFDALEEALSQHGDAVAGVIVEPVIQGAAGMQMYAPSFLRRARELTRAVDTFLIVDEVFTGLGRTGARWACDLAGVSPDVMCLAKSLTGATLPFAATLATERIFDGFRGGRERAFLYGHTYCGNPLGAAVAHEALNVFRDEDILGQVARKAPRIAARFAAMGAIPGVARTRALGMVGALDLGGEGYHGGRGWAVYAEARKRGAYLRPLGDTVYIAPALNIPDAELDLLLDIVEDSVRAVSR